MYVVNPNTNFIKQFPTNQKEAACECADKEVGYLILNEGDLLCIPMREMVMIYNQTADRIGNNQPHVKRFADRKSATKRVTTNLLTLFTLEQEASKETNLPKGGKLLVDKVQTGDLQPRTVKPGTVTGVAFNLLKKPIHVDDFVVAMNKVSVNWNRSNAWGSVRYILFVKKGWGLKIENEMISLIDGE